MKRVFLAAIFAALSFPSLAQVADQDHVWATPGNSSVGGGVPMCPRASDGKAIPCSFSAPASGSLAAGYPNGATPITASATGTTAATTATLAAVAGKTTYLCGFSINSTATGAAAGNATVTGTVTGTLNFEMGTGLSPAVVVTNPSIGPACIPASAANTAINVISAAPGAGGVISVTAWGFQF